MARLDRVKNLSGLAEWFAGNKRLRKLVNLVIVGEASIHVLSSVMHTPAHGQLLSWCLSAWRQNVNLRGLCL